jgi:hypothetical protein
MSVEQLINKLKRTVQTMLTINKPTNIQTGYLYTTDGKKFDVSVILNFPNEADYENLDDFPSTNLVDFYFGEPNDRDTDRYVNKFVDRQTKLHLLLNKLYNLKIVCPDDTEIDEQIEFVKSLIVTIH